MLQSQARTERELSGTPAEEFWNLEQESQKLEIRDWTFEKGRWTFGHCSKPNSYECELLESEYLPSISFKKFRVVVGGELRL